MQRSHAFAPGALLAALMLGAIGIAATAPAPRPAPPAHATVRPFLSVTPGSVTLYDQNGNDAGLSNSSQNFESGLDAYDDQGADDFKVPKGHTWIVKEVDVTGVYSGGPAKSENVFFYKDRAGLPGALVAKCDRVAGKDDGYGSFAIKIPAACPVELNAGKYWLSVQTDQDFSCCGQWFWEETSIVTGNMGAWRQPGDAWGTGCTKWQTLSTCWGNDDDFMFALKGRDKT